MSAIQLSFSLRVSSGVKTVHLLGSWDNYVGQIPLSKDKTSSKAGSWKGTFRFQNATLVPGQRYWYYYIIDGYHATHNPSEESVVEPTTGRELNILEVSKSSAYKERSSRQRTSLALEVPKGRPLSVSQIKAPKPVSPNSTKRILNSDFYGNEDLDELVTRFDSVGLDESAVGYYSSSPISSSGSSLSYSSDSASGYSTPSSECSSCICERYGITRKGDRVKLDCGGSLCGYGDSDSDCSSDDEPSPVRYVRRNAMIVG